MPTKPDAFEDEEEKDTVKGAPERGAGPRPPASEPEPADEQAKGKKKKK